MATDIIAGQLLENAFKYSPSGGTVTVRARAVADRIDVTVEDEGIGISPGDHERIFERFVQGEAGDRRRFGGIGLGLYIVRQARPRAGRRRYRPGRGQAAAPSCGSGCERAGQPRAVPAGRARRTGLLADQPLTGVRSRRSPPAASR